MTVLFLSIFLSIRRRISDMQRFLSSLGWELVYKQQEGKFKLPCTKIIIICFSQGRVSMDRLRVKTQARREGADVQSVLSRMKTDCSRHLLILKGSTQFFSILLWKLTVVQVRKSFFCGNHMGSGKL